MKTYIILHILGIGTDLDDSSFVLISIIHCDTIDENIIKKKLESTKDLNKIKELFRDKLSTMEFNIFQATFDVIKKDISAMPTISVEFVHCKHPDNNCSTCKINELMGGCTHTTTK